MGIFRAFSGAISGTLADQWKDIITAGIFDEHVVVSPGIHKAVNRGYGENLYASDGVISNGSKIYVPENTACFIFDQSGIEEIITDPGGYEYQNGQESVFDALNLTGALLNQVKTRFSYGGVPSDCKRVAFVNLREIRDIKFGTRGPQVYNDFFYGTDLEVFAFGSFTVQITDPVAFIQKYVPANITFYTFDDEKVRSQILAEFLQSFTVALNSLSSNYRISQLPAQSHAIASVISTDNDNVGTWEQRFGFKLVKVAIENIEFTEQSRMLIHTYSENRMRVKAYDDISQQSSNVAAQQQIAQGIKDNGLGDVGGMLFGINVAQGLGTNADSKTLTSSLEDQIERLKKLKELVDIGILTQEEFDAKKKEVMNF